MINEIEMWANISGYEEYYSISNKGRVLSKRYDKLLTPVLGGNGYFRVSLCANGQFKIIEIHRSVALHFLNNNQNKPQVNHKDGDKLNNKVENLEWVSGSENINHAIANKLIKKVYHINHFGGLVGNNNFRKKRVAQIDIHSNKVIKIFESISEAMKELNVTANIVSVCRGRRKTSGGYIWKYA